jgi:hypothetical protein
MLNTPFSVAIMEVLGYPLDTITLVKNPLFEASTSQQPHPYKISTCTIQGYTLLPYLFIIFLEALLRWMEKILKIPTMIRHQYNNDHNLL